MSMPAILGMRSSTRQWPGRRPKKDQRLGSLVVWAKPNPINRVRTMGNGGKIMPNRGAVILRG